MITQVTTITATCDNCGTEASAPMGLPPGWFSCDLQFKGSDNVMDQSFQFCNQCYTSNSGMTTLFASKVNGFTS